MNSELYQFIKEAVAKAAGLPVEKLGDDDHFQDDLEMDSLEAIEVLHSIEKRYRVKFGEIELESMQTLMNIYNAAERLLGEG